MSDLVEKVARAIWKTREEMFPGYQRLSWEETTEIARKAATADARAALRVVREAQREHARGGVFDQGGTADGRHAWVGPRHRGQCPDDDAIEKGRQG